MTLVELVPLLWFMLRVRNLPTIAFKLSVQISKQWKRKRASQYYYENSLELSDPLKWIQGSMHNTLRMDALYVKEVLSFQKCHPKYISSLLQKLCVATTNNISISNYRKPIFQYTHKIRNWVLWQSTAYIIKEGLQSSTSWRQWPSCGYAYWLLPHLTSLTLF